MPENELDMLKPQVVVFDVYETMLDMSGVERKINGLTDSKRGYIIWFELFMQYCFVNNSLDTFQDFMSIGKATLQMTGNKLGKAISDVQADDVLQLLKHLPILEEVPPVLSQLRDDGYRITALTNAPEKLVCDRMEQTGLISYFENVLSAEKIKKYKPEKQVYQWAAAKLNVNTTEMLMITSHTWDVAGAANAGMKTAYLQRRKQNTDRLSPTPDLTCKTLIELASMLTLHDNEQTN
jgi:2-haloacid dehalogenase